MIRRAATGRAAKQAQNPTRKISVVIETPSWREDAAALRLIRRAAKLALRQPFHPPLEGGSKTAPRSEDGFGEEGARNISSPKSSSRLRSRKISTVPQGEGGTFVTILLSDDARLKTLNRDFRGKNKPTNVLSFPGEDGAYMGDIAIAHQTVAGEARHQTKPFANHVAHLVIHGILHLLGYDHEDVNQAAIMETLEIRLLSSLGIPSPYEPPPLTRRKKAA